MTNRDIIIAVVSTLVVCLFGPYVSNSLGSQVTAVLELFKVNESDIRVINSIITTFLVVVTISVVICIGLYFKYWKKEAETIVMQCYSSRTPQLNSTPIHRNPQVNHVQHERIGKTTKEPEIFTGKEPEFWFKRFRLYVENNGIAPHKQLMREKVDFSKNSGELFFICKKLSFNLIEKKFKAIFYLTSLGNFFFKEYMILI